MRIYAVYTHTPRPESRPRRGDQRSHAAKAGFGIESVKTSHYTITISTSLCRWPGGERLVWLGPNLPLCRGPQRQKVKRFTGETRRKPSPHTRPGRSEEEEASTAPRARQAARGGRSGRLEGELLGVRVASSTVPRIQWLMVVCEANHVRAVKEEARPSRCRKRVPPGFIFVQS